MCSPSSVQGQHAPLRPRLWDSSPGPLWLGDSQHHPNASGGRFWKGISLRAGLLYDADVYPPWCPVQCLALRMSSRNACRTMVWPFSSQASCVQGAGATAGPGCRIFSSPGPLAHGGLRSVVTSASLALGTSLRSAGSLSVPAASAELPGNRVCAPPRAVRTGGGVAKAEPFPVHSVLFR